MEDVISALQEWVMSLGLQYSIRDVQDLIDGRTLWSLCQKISAEDFQKDGLAVTSSENWALCYTNLKKLLKAIEAYYHRSLKKTADFGDIDLSAIAKEKDEQALTMLIELVVGAAIHCEDKATYIGKIMSLSEDSQVVLKNMVERVMARTRDLEISDPSSSVRDIDSAEKEKLFQQMAAQIQRDKENLEEEIYILQSQLNECNEERNRLSTKLAEHEMAKEEMDQKARPDASEAEAESVKLSEQLSEMKRRLQLKESKCMSVEQELETFRKQLDGEKKMREKYEMEVRQMEEELDIARSKSNQLLRAEATIEKYKIKLDEVGNMKQQMKELEDQNSKYLDKVLDLESTIKTIPRLKQTLESYKDQNVQMEREKFELQSSIQVLEAEMSKLREELTAANDARRFFEDELLALREQHEANENGSASNTSHEGERGDHLFESYADLREKCLRLERQLRDRGNDLGDSTADGYTAGDESSQLMLLRSQLDDALRLKSERENLAMDLKRKNAEQEMEIAKLKESVTQMMGDTSEGGEGARIHSISNEREQELLSEIAALKSQSSTNDSLRITIEMLTEKLKEKETVINNLTSDKEKLETYTKKTLHKVQEKYLVALQSCKSQLAEKSEKIEHLENSRNKDRQASKREERLMMSTIYELGMEIIERRLMNSVSDSLNMSSRQGSRTGSSSFLQRKRDELSGKLG